jgi:DNA-directed RNA polymerase subunit F
MNILNRRALSLGEVKGLLGEAEGEENKVMHDYLKAFSSLDKAKAEKLCQEVRDLNNPKIKEENIVKIADFQPKDMEDINKIFVEVSLTEEEGNAILEIVKRY